MSSARSLLDATVTVAGFALLVPVGLLYVASGLVVPLPWLVGVWALGAAVVAFAVWSRRRPWVVLATPVVAVVLWVVIVTVGEALLDWTA